MIRSASNHKDVSIHLRVCGRLSGWRRVEVTLADLHMFSIKLLRLPSHVREERERKRKRERDSPQPGTWTFIPTAISVRHL